MRKFLLNRINHEKLLNCCHYIRLDDSRHNAIEILQLANDLEKQTNNKCSVPLTRDYRQWFYSGNNRIR